MKYILLQLILLISPLFCFGQTTEKNYYADQSLTNKVSRAKAYYQQTKTANPDGTLTIEVTELKSKSVIRKEIYLKDEPVGNWLTNINGKIKALDYNFRVLYTPDICKGINPDEFIGFKENNLFNPLQDNESLGYIAPKIQSGEKNIAVFVARNIVYPFQAIASDRQGKVMVTVLISETGAVETIGIYQGVNMLLDKEAFRIFRNLKLQNPPLLNGKAKKLCLQIPVVFRLED